MTRSALPKSKAKTAYALLSDVRKLILAEPKRYRQGDYIIRKKEQFPDVAEAMEWPTCGTVGCVAGWVATLKGPPQFTHTQTEEIAQQVLGITWPQAAGLFDGGAAKGEPQTLAHAKAGAAHIAAFQKKYAKRLKAKKV